MKEVKEFIELLIIAIIPALAFIVLAHIITIPTQYITVYYKNNTTVTYGPAYNYQIIDNNIMCIDMQSKTVCYRLGNFNKIEVIEK